MPRNPLIVLDTNAVLDWLLFDDPHGREVGRAIAAGALDWVATVQMMEEHFEVLGRPSLARWMPDATAQRRLWEAHCRTCPAPPSMANVPGLRSADPDDQMFVDLAVSEGAVWLVSRDRALLDLDAALQRRGVTVLTPAAWAAGAHGGPA